MKKDELYDAIACLDENLQEQAYELEKSSVKTNAGKKSPGKWIIAPIAAAAAFIIVAVVLAVILMPSLQPTNVNIPGGETGHEVLLSTEKPEGGKVDEGQDPLVYNAIAVSKLSYSGLNGEVISFLPTDFGATLIALNTEGEHKNCAGVYYNKYDGTIVCLEHELRNALGGGFPEGCELIFDPDSLDANKILVTAVTSGSSDTFCSYVLDRTEGMATAVSIPDGFTNYNEYRPAQIFGGKLLVMVNVNEGPKYLEVSDLKTGEQEKKIEIEDVQYINGSFIGENVLQIITDKGFYFYNLTNDLLAGVVGEYNYFFGGKVFSVKNNMGYLHSDVSVAAYDAETGEALANEKVLVETTLDDGSRVFLLKDTGTGEETVVIADYDINCSAWLSDHSRFYAYSSKNGKLACYYLETGTIETVDVEGASTEPEQICDDTYAAFVSYNLVLGNEPGDVILYYSRNVFKVEKTPVYEDEQVYSPFFEEYCDIKFRNFPEETSFTYANKNGIVDNLIYDRQVDDMEMLRDIIILTFEGKGQAVDGNTLNGDITMVGYLKCGSFRIIFYEIGEDIYFTLESNQSPLAENRDGTFECSAEVLDKINKKITGYFVIENQNDPYYGVDYEDKEFMTLIVDPKNDLQLVTPYITPASALVYYSEIGQLVEQSIEPVVFADVLANAPVISRDKLFLYDFKDYALIDRVKVFDVSEVDPEGTVDQNCVLTYTFDGYVVPTVLIEKIVKGAPADCIVAMRVRAFSGSTYIPEIDQSERYEYWCFFRLK